MYKVSAMVRKGGFEPPRLSAPPPQDGVSASSTTSAQNKPNTLNSLTRSAPEGVSTGCCTDLSHSTRASGAGCPAHKRFPAAFLRGMYVAHRHFNVIVSRHILQCKGVGVLTRDCGGESTKAAVSQIGAIPLSYA
jgi:hypothetical protein